MASKTTDPIDPRIERTRQVVLAAATELVAEVGYGDVTIDAIGERSGVARSTIYRHWKQLPELILDALSAAIEVGESPDTGVLRDDLVAFIGEFSGLLTSASFRQIAIALVVESHRDPAIAELHGRFLRARQECAVTAIERGIERGELPSSVDPTTMTLDLVAPVFFRAVVLRAPLDGDFIEGHVDRWIEIHRGDANGA